MRAQHRIDVVHQDDIGRIVQATRDKQTFTLKQFFDIRMAVFSQCDLAAFSSTE